MRTLVLVVILIHTQRGSRSPWSDRVCFWSGEMGYSRGVSGPAGESGRKDYTDGQVRYEPGVQAGGSRARPQEPWDAPRGAPLPYHPDRYALPPDPLRHPLYRSYDLRASHRGECPPPAEAELTAFARTIDPIAGCK